ncbi:A disintegrin and metalloproteinase with thrombospondin motifs 6-like isoform X1 [Oculina patagonica]
MFVFSRCLVVIGTLLFLDAKPLHRHMTEIEIQKFFGVQTSADVPRYEVTEPYQTNENGEFVSHTLHERHTRDIHNSGAWYYKMDAFGNKMHLKLTRNTQLVKPGLALETRHENGDVTRTPVKSDSLFHGKDVSDPDSLVAVSNDKGLTGMIKLSSETLFVHPLPDHLAQHVTTGSGAKPHLVYRKSAIPLNCGTKAGAASNLVATGIKNDVSSDSYNPPAHKYLQAALVVDENVVAKHGNGTADFLLVLANIVAGTFRDNSIGNIKVNYVVSRIITITNKELNLKPDSPTGEKLSKIREWAYKNKPANKSDPLYFDDISLIHVGHGGGLAIAGGMCSYRVTGNVNGYSGLQTAGIIAHETAHNIGVWHDVDYNCSNGVNIMSTRVIGGEGALKWSTCSRDVLQNFFSGPGSKCLDDPPQITLPGFNNTDVSDKLPGVLYDGNTQCAFQYGAGWRRCFTDNCALLWCTNSGSVCHSNFAPPADGTTCGPRHWCIKGKCVDNGSPIINGGWSKWSDSYSPCSATCGGGVKYRHRTCTNPPPSITGEDCLGSAKGKWKICNSQTECPLPISNSRDLLCKKVHPGTRAYYDGNSCGLACITPELLVWYYGSVPDGFRCTDRPDIFDVCIGGKCRAVGCDHVLESGAKKDRCGICGGNGETCILVNSSYTKDARNYGFDKENLIVVLPVGTANAIFKQRKVGYNMLGIKDHLTGQYIIKLPSWSVAVYYNGTRIEYKHEENRFNDSIMVDGPTKVPLRMTFVYLYERNQGVDIQYYRPLLSNETAQKVSSKWVTGEWSVCSVKCGQGVISRDVSCVRSDDGTPASTRSCSGKVKPQSRKSCQPQSCSPEWHLTNWNECSKTCGNGSHFRLLYCRKKLNESYYEKLDESLCNGLAKPSGSKPLFQRCNEVPCPAEWRTLPWSECSKTCGGGLMTRKLECIRTDELGHVIPAAKELCRYAMKPLTEAICNDDKPCDPPPEIQVACFIGADNLEEVLGDFTKEIKWDNTNEVVKKCAKLAHAKDYKLYALGKSGLCLSGPNTRNRYFIGGTYGAYCKDGIGMGDSMFVYTLDHMPSLQALGCYHDSYYDRALSDLYAIFRDQIIWTNMEKTVKQCARVAYDKGYEYFAIQFYGECFGGKDAGKHYAKHGNSGDCWVFNNQTGHGVGGDMTNFVYRVNKDLITAV